MSDSTKEALALALEEILLSKSLNKITINDITSSCGVNRQTFYYHFKDIYDLLEWTMNRNVKEFKEDLELEDVDTIEYVYHRLLSNKKKILNIYSSVDTRWFNQYLIKIFEKRIRAIIDKKVLNGFTSEENDEFLIRFYSFGVVGTVTLWIDNGMPDEYDEDIKKINQLLNIDLITKILNKNL